MKRLVNYLIFIFSILFLFLIINFSLTSKVVYGPLDDDFVTFTRILPESYEKGVPFEVLIQIEFEKENLIDESLFFGEVIFGGEIVSVHPLEDFVEFRDDVLFWGDLELRNKIVSYQVISNSDSVRFEGKWGLNVSGFFCTNCEGKIMGDKSLSTSGEKIFVEDKEEISGSVLNGGGGGGGSGGGGFVSSNGEVLDSGDVDLDESFFEEVSFLADVSQESGFSENGGEDSSLNLLWIGFIFFFSFFIVILLIVIFLKIKKSRENSFYPVQ